MPLFLPYIAYSPVNSLFTQRFSNQLPKIESSRSWKLDSFSWSLTGISMKPILHYVLCLKLWVSLSVGMTLWTFSKRGWGTSSLWNKCGLPGPYRACLRPRQSIHRRPDGWVIIIILFLIPCSSDWVALAILGGFQRKYKKQQPPNNSSPKH